MQRQLIIIAGPEKGRSFQLEDGQTLTIGRGEASDTKINDPRMSRVHCRVQVDGGRTVLFDSGGTGGTWVHDQQVAEKKELQPGSIIRVGDTQIRYDFSGDREASTIVGMQSPVAAAKPVTDVAPLQSLVGQSLAHYQLEKIIHKGNTGMVFLATDTKKNRKAAVKVLSPDVTKDEEEKERFVRAVQTMINIHHENIVELYHSGKKGPYCWSEMEYVDGPSILEVIDLIGVQGMLDWRESFRVAVHIARALNCAYENKIIHRNVTPQNLLQRKHDKTVKLCDLMLAKALEGSMAKQVTQAGQLVGDVAYMSPERTREGAQVDHRSDLYGLGATLYALLTGHPPFESDSLPELVRMVRDAEPVNPKEKQLSIDDRFKDAVLQLLAKNPDDRFQSPAELLRDLERIGKYAGLDSEYNYWS